MTIGKVASILLILLILSNGWWFGHWLMINNSFLFAPVIIISGIGTLVLFGVLLNLFCDYLKKHW